VVVAVKVDMIAFMCKWETDISHKYVTFNALFTSLLPSLLDRIATNIINDGRDSTVTLRCV
jgi:hypothetical protein